MFLITMKSSFQGGYNDTRYACVSLCALLMKEKLNDLFSIKHLIPDIFVSDDHLRKTWQRNCLKLPFFVYQISNVKFELYNSVSGTITCDTVFRGCLKPVSDFSTSSSCMIPRKGKLLYYSVKQSVCVTLRVMSYYLASWTLWQYGYLNVSEQLHLIVWTVHTSKKHHSVSIFLSFLPSSFLLYQMCDWINLKLHWC
jgi:hypothetical protein